MRNWIAPLYLAIVLAVFVAAGAGPVCAAAAVERFKSVNTQVTLDTDGMLTVRHEIVVVAGGSDFRRGLTLHLPGTIGPITEMQVTRDGLPESFPPNLIRSRRPTLRIGAEDRDIEPGEHTYVIRYWARRPLVERTVRDTLVEMLEWQPLMADERIPWITSRLEVMWPGGRAPREVGSGTSRVWQWRGPLGGPGDGRPLENRVRLTWWPTGTFPESAVRRVVVSPVLRYLAPLGFILVWLAYHLTYFAVVRHREPVIITTATEPPQGISPAAARYISAMGETRAGFAAALMDLVLKGVMTAARTGTAVRLALLGEVEAPPASNDEKMLAAALFEKGREADLGGDGTRVLKGMAAQEKALANQFLGRTFKSNLGAWLQCLLLVPALAAFVVWQIVKPGSNAAADTLGLTLAIASIVASLVTGLIYLRYFKAPTAQGRVLMDRIEGLKAYLNDENPLSGIDADPAHFFELLPYAVALDAEGPWAARFGAALDSASDPEAAKHLSWYRAFTGSGTDPDHTTFTSAILPVIAGVTSQAATQPDDFSAGPTDGHA